MSVSVVVLAFNEEGSIDGVVREIHSVLRSIGQDYEIIIVDDGSTDRTSGLADQLEEALEGVRAIHHPTNRGLGDGYRTGFLAAQGGFVTFFAADGQSSADIIKKFIPLMKNADMILGYTPRRNSSLLAKGLSKAERILYRVLFGSFPKFQGVLMFRRTILDDLKLTSTGRGWGILMELIIRTQKAGYRIISVPTELRPRASGRSKVNNIRNIGSNLKQILALRANI